MATTIQVIEKNNNIQDLINLDNTDLDSQIVTHDDEVVALNYATQQQPEMILLDHQITDLDTSVFVSFLFKESPNSKIMVIGNNLSQEQILSCFLAGAKGYMDQRSVETLINKAIGVILNNEVWITRKMTAILLQRLRNL